MRDELLEHLNNHGRNKNYYDSDYASDLPDYIYDTRYLRNVTFTNSTVKVFFFFGNVFHCRYTQLLQLPFLNSNGDDVSDDIDWSSILDEVWKEVCSV